MTRQRVTPDTLNAVLEFDVVARVNADGTVETPIRDIAYPDAVYDDEHDGPDDWELLRNRSGQHGYDGPTMHPSEYVGGGLARDILATPGYYVVLVSYALDVEEDEDNLAGWAIAYRPL